MKIPKNLQPLADEGLIDEVCRQLKSGKEATCFEVISEGELRIAKVYKDSAQRGFKNRSQYLEGRTVRSTRERRALAKGSKYGQKQLEAAWHSAEVDALFKLHGAGVRVPTPYVFSSGVLLMQRVADSDGAVAPQLGELRFEPQYAKELHDEMMRQCALMLAAGLVHADLSEFNVLLAAEGPTIIDLPQVVEAAHNREARRIFERDVGNITTFFARFAPELRRCRYGAGIWTAFEKGNLDPEGELPGAAAAQPVKEEMPTPAPTAMRRVVVLDVASSAGNRSGGNRGGGGARGGGGGNNTRNRRGGDARRRGPAPEGRGGPRNGGDGARNGSGQGQSRPGNDWTAQGGGRRLKPSELERGPGRPGLPAKSRSKKPQRGGAANEKEAAIELRKSIEGLRAAMHPDQKKKEEGVKKKTRRRRPRRRRGASQQDAKG